MKSIRTLLALALTALVSVAAMGDIAYPTTNPTYLPNGILPPQSLTAAGTVTATLNGIDTVYVRVAGTGATIVANMQIATERGSSATYTAISCVSVPGGPVSTISANGLYRCAVAGAGSLQFNLSSLASGTVTVDMSGAIGDRDVTTQPIRRTTYMATVKALAPAASATDFFTLTGSATTTVRVLSASCDGVSTAAATANVVALLRSTANATGTHSAPTAVPLDSNNAAATATVLAYTANPGTLGTLIGNIDTKSLTTNTAASSAFLSQPTIFDFNAGDEQQVVLRGATQVFALNGAAASFTSGAALNCTVKWTEE